MCHVCVHEYFTDIRTQTHPRQTDSKNGALIGRGYVETIFCQLLDLRQSETTCCSVRCSFRYQNVTL